MRSAITRRNLHTRTRVFLLSLILSFASISGYASSYDLSEQVKYKEELVRQLKDEIQQIDNEMSRCEKSKKGWVAATVIGGVGVAATGTAAIVQAVKLKEKQNPDKETTEPKESKK